MDLLIVVFATAVLQLLSMAVTQYLPPLPFPFPPGGIPGMPQVGQPNGFPPPETMPPGSVPMPMPMPFGVQQPRVPLVVMPYHSKKKPQTRRIKKKKKRPAKKYMFEDSSSESNSDSSSDFNFRARSKPGKKRQVLTPVVSYVTKDGYVVYQKKIKKEKARDWLEMGRQKQSNRLQSGEGDNVSDNLSKVRFSKKRHRY